MMLCGRTVLVCLLVVLASTALAHEKRHQRTLVLQLDSKGLAGLWTMSVSGKQANILHAMHDINRDGQLAPIEQSALARTLVEKALAGVVLEVAGRVIGPSRIDARLAPREAAAGVLIARGLVEYEMKLAPDAFVPLTIRVKKGYGELSVQIQTLDPWILGSSTRGDLAADGHGLAHGAHLQEGEHMTLEVRRSADNKQPGGEQPPAQ